MRSVVPTGFGRRLIIDEVGGDVAISHESDVTAILDRNKRAQNEIGIRADAELTPVASIPFDMIHLFKSVYHLDFFDADDFEKIVSLIETDSDLRYLRTNSKVICG